MLVLSTMLQDGIIDKKDLAKAEKYLADDNGRIPVNEYVSQTIEAGDATHLFIYYYTSNGTRDFLDIRNTISVYKIESNLV